MMAFVFFSIEIVADCATISMEKKNGEVHRGSTGGPQGVHRGSTGGPQGVHRATDRKKKKRKEKRNPTRTKEERREDEMR